MWGVGHPHLDACLVGYGLVTREMRKTLEKLQSDDLPTAGGSLN